jgi:hypothetical protein
MKTLFVVKSNAQAGREDEYNSWYNNIHLPEILKIDGFLSAQRFALGAAQMLDAQSHGYLAIYEIDSKNVAQTLENLRQATWLTRSDAIDQPNAEVSVFRAVTERMVSAS